MGYTRLKRKTRVRVVKSSRRKFNIKKLSFKPVIKNIDTEELKKQFMKSE